MQTDDINDSDPASVQESGSQTDVDSLTWVETWIESTMQILNTIEEISLTTNNCLNVLQDLQNVQNEFCEYSNNPDQNSEILQKKLKIVAEKTEKVRDATLQTCHWDELVKSTIESQNESEIQTLLTLIPQGAPHSRKLKEALKNLPKVRKIRETSFILTSFSKGRKNCQTINAAHIPGVQTRFRGKLQFDEFFQFFFLHFS